MDAFLAVASKREVRTYSARPLPDDAVHRILEAGRIAGSSQNRQRRTFVVVSNPELREQLAEAVYAPRNVRGAALVVVVVVQGGGPVAFVGSGTRCERHPSAAVPPPETDAANAGSPAPAGSAASPLAGVPIDGEDPPVPTNCWVSPLAQKSSASKASSSCRGASTVAVVDSAGSPDSPVSGSTPSLGTQFDRGNLMSFPCSSRGPALSADPAKLAFYLLSSYHTPNFAIWGSPVRKLGKSYA